MSWTENFFQISRSLNSATLYPPLFDPVFFCVDTTIHFATTLEAEHYDYVLLSRLLIKYFRDNKECRKTNH